MKVEISEIIAKVINIPADDIPKSEDYFEKFAVNSLKQLEIVDEIEDNFNIKINLKENFKNIRYLDRLEKLVEELIEK